MTISVASHGAIELTGACPVEDAEILLRYLLDSPHAPIDWAACESAHSAVIQVLLVANAKPQGSPKNLFLRHHIGPLLLRSGT